MRLPVLAAVLLVLSGAGPGCLGNRGGDGSGPSPTTEPPGGGAGHNQTLTVDFMWSPKEPTVGLEVSFQDASSDSEFDLTEHAWDFGDGFGSTGVDPTHRFLKADLFKVTLRVKNEAGSEAVAAHFVNVRARGPEPTPTGADPPIPSDYLGFGEPVTVQGVDGGEPSLAIGSDGKIFVNPIGNLYRSTDGGKSFHPLSYISVLAGDSHVVVDRDRRVWVSDLGGATVPPYGSITVWVSENGGDSFDKGNPAASDSVMNDRNWLAAPGGGKGFLLYRQCQFIGIGCLATSWSQMTRSLNGGVDWTLLPSLFSWDAFPFVDPDSGTLYVVQATGTSVVVRASTDDGLTFTDRTVSQRTTAPANVFMHGDVGDDGTAYVVWVDKDTSQYDVWMAFSTDSGASWSPPHRVSSGIGTNVFPWVAGAGPGRVAIAWYGTRAVGSPDELVDAQWYVYTAFSQTIGDARPTFVQSRATGYPVHTGPICTMGSGCAGNDRDLLDFLSVDVTPDGLVAVAFGEDGGGDTTRTRFVLQNAGPRLRQE